jgi:alkaline phosphatase D
MPGDRPAPPAIDDRTVGEWNRRRFLAGLVGVAVGPAFLPRLTGGAPAGPVFGHGVASGDPTPDGIVLWTRVIPEGRRRNGRHSGSDAERDG